MTGAFLREKILEGLAIGWAVVSGECSKCPYYKRCSADEAFCPPADSWCMKKKKELLETQK